MPAGVWGVNLINEPDGALRVPAKLVLGVHQQQASLGRLRLAIRKQLQGGAADLQGTTASAEPSAPQGTTNLCPSPCKSINDHTEGTLLARNDFCCAVLPLLVLPARDAAH